jgi:hypothetical protein
MNATVQIIINAGTCCFLDYDYYNCAITKTTCNQRSSGNGYSRVPVDCPLRNGPVVVLADDRLLCGD